MGSFIAGCTEVGKLTFSRGRGVMGGGRLSKTPVGVELIGHVPRSWFMSACAPSRAVAERSSSRSPWRRRGFGSFASKKPRSKVYGVGLLTVTGSFDRSVDSAIVEEICRVLLNARGCEASRSTRIICDLELFGG
jgi:hypothetical protein